MVESWSYPMEKKSGTMPPTNDSEHDPLLEIVPDPEQFETLLQDVLDSVKKYRESQQQKEEPGPEEG